MARILIIDDEALVRTMIERILTRSGHEITLATDGKEGVEKYKIAPANLVLVDLVMPTQEGLETIIQLRRECPTLPIIAMSGKPAARVLLDLAQRIGTATLLKP